MIIETKVPEDVRKFKTKSIGPFTTRQLICGAIAVGIDIPVCIGFYMSGMNLMNLVYVVCFVDIPVMIFAFDVKGVPMKTYLMKILLPSFFAPAKRRSVTKLVDRGESHSTSKEFKERQNRERKAGFIAYK